MTVYVIIHDGMLESVWTTHELAQSAVSQYIFTQNGTYVICTREVNTTFKPEK